jgi:hypothetical protein
MLRSNTAWRLEPADATLYQQLLVLARDVTLTEFLEPFVGIDVRVDTSCCGTRASSARNSASWHRCSSKRLRGRRLKGTRLIQKQQKVEQAGEPLLCTMLL